jgi:hypothetical protein
MNAGTYEAQWNAADLPSGIYLFKFSTNKFSDSKKMMLIK